MVIDPKNLIVCYKHKQSAGQKALGVFLPILFWGVLLYILSTFFALCSWTIDYSLFSNIIDYKDILAIKTVMSRYFPVIGGFVCAFLLWALYNKLRFQGSRNRRTTRPVPVSLDETAGFCGLDTAEIRRMQQTGIMTCLFDDAGNITGVRYHATTLPARKKTDMDRNMNPEFLSGPAVQLATSN